jgi:hypothetical protein
MGMVEGYVDSWHSSTSKRGDANSGGFHWVRPVPWPSPWLLIMDLVDWWDLRLRSIVSSRYYSLFHFARQYLTLLRFCVSSGIVGRPFSNKEALLYESHFILPWLFVVHLQKKKKKKIFCPFPDSSYSHSTRDERVVSYIDFLDVPR